jgi:sensor histidine kinase YesM
VLYYLLVVVMVILMTVLVVYLAQGLDTAQKLRAQRDMIAQQQLYERELETIRQETRAFRHDYKNLLAGLSQQAGEGELEKVRRTLTQLDVGFDLRLGRRIQLSTQIGNIQLPEVRSLLLSKLAAMGERGVECRLEALYPVGAVDMDIWDLTRCLGILLDNALEAALETEEPWVEILLLAQEGKLFLRVSNPYTGSLDPGKLWEEGWSTKGTGRGLGLSGYQRILRGYPNASSCTRWDRGIFVQELTVEDRT